MTGVLLKSRDLDTETDVYRGKTGKTLGEHRGNMQAGMWVLLLKAGDCQRLWENHLKCGERHEQPSEGTSPADTLMSSLGNVRQYIARVPTIRLRYPFEAALENESTQPQALSMVNLVWELDEKGVLNVLHFDSFLPQRGIVVATCQFPIVLLVQDACNMSFQGN